MEEEGEKGLSLFEQGVFAQAGEIFSCLAKEKPNDGTVTYVFTLRDNLKWSDGQAFTARDIVFTWQRLVDPATVADYSYMIDMVKNAN